MDGSEGPSLVPQWLKSSSASSFANGTSSNQRDDLYNVPGSLIGSISNSTISTTGVRARATSSLEPIRTATSIDSQRGQRRSGSSVFDNQPRSATSAGASGVQTTTAFGPAGWHAAKAPLSYGAGAGLNSSSAATFGNGGGFGAASSPLLGPPYASNATAAGSSHSPRASSSYATLRHAAAEVDGTGGSGAVGSSTGPQMQRVFHGGGTNSAAGTAQAGGGGRASTPGGTHPYQKVTFEKEFPSLKDVNHGQLSYAPSAAPYKDGFLSARIGSNWTSKLADVPPPEARAFPMGAGAAAIAAAAAAAGPNIGTGSDKGVPTAERSPCLGSAQPLPNGASSGTGGLGGWSATIGPAVGGGRPPGGTIAVASGPNMAEALQQHHTPSLISSLVDRQRLEERAVKQSKQLIPVLASATKTKPTGITPAATGVARGPSDSRSLSVSTAVGRKPVGSGGDDGRTGSSTITMALPRKLSASLTAPSANVAPLSVAMSDGGDRHPDAKNARNSFFDSLRKKGTGHPEAIVSSHASLAEDAISAPAQARIGQPSATLKSCNGQPYTVKSSGSTVAVTPVSGAEDEAIAPSVVPLTVEVVVPDAGDATRFVVPDEEEAFLRSLGWTADSEDEEDGNALTEEEIAAFRATAQIRTSSGQLPYNVGGLSPGGAAAAIAAKAAAALPLAVPALVAAQRGAAISKNSVVAASFGSEQITTTDSDSD